MADEQRFLIVRLGPGLHVSRHVGITHSIAQTPGVECVFGSDLSVLGLDARAMTLLLGLPLPKTKARRGKKVA
jgi:hypothetical protein